MKDTAEKSSLKLAHVSKRIGNFLLQADFEVAAGERAALCGPSGSGKTTLLRMIAGLEEHDRGQVLLNGRDVSALAPAARGIGFVFQDQALFPSMNVFENAVFGLKMRGVPPEIREAEGMEWLRRMNLDRRARSTVGQLSGGERQRVAFVRALIWKPSLLLLDEPFSALDRELRRTLHEELLQLHQLWPVPMILVSHDEVDVASISSVRLEIQAGVENEVLLHRVRRSDSI